MKKFWGTLIIAIMLTLILSSCSRDLSTPSSRLVGHWVEDTVLKTEYYYSEIDSRTQVGTLTEYDPRDGKVVTCKYDIFSEVSNEDNVTLEEACPGEITMIVDYVVKEDGTTALRMSTRMNYVDTKTKP